MTQPRGRRAGPRLRPRLGTLVGTMDTKISASRRRLPPVPRSADDAAQVFVARVRAAASEFAAAAGAQSAVVREVVPPARHRRSRCRVVLRDVGGAERDLTFLGPADRPGADVPFEAAVQ